MPIFRRNDTCRGSSAAFTNRKVRQPLDAVKGDLIAAEERIKAIKFLVENINLGMPMQATAELLDVCQRTLRRWRIHISGKGFSIDQRKGAQRNVAHKLSIQERQNIINVINEMRFTHLPPAQVVAILAEEGNYIGSEMTI